MDWDARLYDQSHDFVAAYGESLLGLLPDGLGFAVDVGCGTGALTGPLTAKAARVVGIDTSPDMIAQARLREPQVEFLVMDACKMPWNGCVDALFSNAALHWIEDQERLTAAMARALRPGGLLVVSDLMLRQGYAPASADSDLGGIGSSCLAGARAETDWRGLMTTAGFTLMHFEDNSRALVELAARMIWYGDDATRPAADYGSQGCACGGAGPGKAWRAYGYGLWIARKETL